MHWTLKRKLAIATSALAATAFAGGAYAATSSSTNSRQAFLNDVAKRLNVSPQQLDDALKGAFDDQLAAAVTAGRLTQAQANMIKQRIAQRGLPPAGFAGPGRFLHPGPGFLPGRGPAIGGFQRHGRLTVVAQYLGLGEAQLLDQLRSGKSLAQIAGSRGKSVSGLKSALTSAAKARLDKAVAAKLLRPAQEQQILSNLSARLDAMINHTGSFGMGRRFNPPSPGLPNP